MSQSCATGPSVSRPAQRRWTTAPLPVAAALLVGALVLTGCEPTEPAASPSAPSLPPAVSAPAAAEAPAVASPRPAPDTSTRPLDELSTTALATLATLPVKGRAPKTGYSRDMFGQRWSDGVDVEYGRNGCDTRNDILRRDLTQTSVKAGTRDCVVLSGTLHDPYTGKTIEFVRGSATSSAVQIDHVVALSDAWQKGAQQLSTTERTNFANDPRNLLAVDGPANQAKSDSDAATWLPPNRSYRCTFVAKQIEVKAAYRLWVTRAEHDVMQRLLTDCGGTVPDGDPEPAAQQTSSTPAPGTPAPRSSAPPTRPQPLVDPAGPDGQVYYKNCTEARAAGAAPIYRGQPGYSSKLDGDGDGIACE
ncbi:hypothetical protein GOHSU_19_00470 [Gordonia hirsuta DSM 44140 = NBRC 16056]|uniref:Excalibur calcium-binding domain-containing protein n=1 Tax=Gordonia hirsuta DSM 44140 = NBRC 16056 TaxID=1121927 RepID=L7LBK7_9ACTN|nr:DUF1524 domain-containing protein [Gordonia hirsuta]GAC57442.1 hypothetical protein GOHSU_19_00470 [Gordonia hirsuta DSM 44140 = NBRC 16056]